MNNERNNKRRWNSNNDFGIRKSGIQVEVKNGQFERAMRKFKKKPTQDVFKKEFKQAGN